jgi:hypothetical protein
MNFWPNKKNLVDIREEFLEFIKGKRLGYS